MKITLIVLGVLVLLLAGNALVMFLLQRRRQGLAQGEGVVVYATVAAVEAVGIWGKRFGQQLGMRKIVLRIQEPGENTPREVSIRTRTDQAAKIEPGMRLPVAIDPKNPARVYPATPEAAKRVTLTGSRLERRQMQSQLRTPSRGRRTAAPGYQPPLSRRR